MKPLLIIVLALLSISVKAQSRWMYLATSTDNSIYLVDTVENDTKQVYSFSGHNNIVIAWFNIYKKVKTKKGSYTTSHVERVAIDTLNKQIATLSFVDYKNEAPVTSSNFAIEWDDIIPMTMAEVVYLQYAKSLKSHTLSVDLFWNAVNHYNPYNQNKSTKQ